MDEKIITSTDGLVIKEISLNEKDKLLTVLTADRGNKTVLVRGVKNIKSKRAPGAMLFSYSTFEFEKKGEREILSDIIPKAGFPGIPLNLKSLALASYIADILAECTFENSDDEELLRLALNSLYAIDKGLKTCDFIKAVFEFKASCALGFAPETDVCHLCGKGIDDTPAYFGIYAGGFCHRSCFESLDAPDPDAYIPLTKSIRDALVFLEGADQKKMLGFTLDGNAELTFEEACEKYLIAKIERKPRTLDYYKKMRNK